jgi:hypothetical protein
VSRFIFHVTSIAQAFSSLTAYDFIEECGSRQGEIFKSVVHFTLTNAPETLSKKMQTEVLPRSSKITLPLTSDGSIQKWFWGKWLFVLACISLIFSATLAIAPFLHKDEFMIVDLGRIILHPKTDWSITWLTNRNEPVLFWSYVGPVMQEFAFQFLGQYGPRIVALLGAFVAATTLVGWLIVKGTIRNVAFILGLVFLLDPLFVQAYTMGRVDGWTIALCISCCWLLADTKNKLPGYSKIKNRVAVSGVLAAFSFFVWPSAVFLFPLILMELFNLVIRYRYIDDNWKKTAMLIAHFAMGGLVAAVLILLPIGPRLYEQFNIVVEGLKTNTRYETLGKEKSQFLTSIGPLIEVFRMLKFSAVLLFIGVISMVWTRNVRLMLAGLLAVALMVFTLVYIHRVQYLIPYLIASVAGIYPAKSKFDAKKFPSLLKDVRLSLLLIWSVGMSLGVRSVLASEGRADKSRRLVYEAAQSMIGKGNYTVFSTYEFYYAGRSMGWKQYTPYLAVGESPSSEDLQQILPHVDYAIMHLSEMTNEIAKLLDKEGMRERGSFYVYSTPGEKADGKTTNISRLRNLYQIYPRPYGPYKLYVREANLNAGTQISR